MQRRVKLALECAVVVVAIASYWLFAVRDPEPPRPPASIAQGERETPPVEYAARRMTAPPSAARTEAASLKVSAPSVSATVRDFRSAPDTLAYLSSLLPRAKAGDAAAQFEIYAGLRYCSEGFRHYFLDQRRDLEAALEWARTRRGLDPENVRRVHDRCHRLMSDHVSDFGAADDWLVRAIDARDPQALVEGANRIAMVPVKPGDDTEVPLAQMRAMTLEALQSKDPRVLWEMSLLGGMFVRLDDGTSPGWEAWQLAACRRGLDCGPESERKLNACRIDPHCQPYETVEDVFRRNLGNAFFAVEATARRVGELLDSGKLDPPGTLVRCADGACRFAPASASRWLFPD